ncbi:Late embryogenesis abundant protein [Chlorella vulgaris]
MAGTKTDNAFEVLSREEAAPEVEHPESAVTHEDVKMGLAASGTLDKDVRGPAGAGNAKKASRGTGFCCSAPGTPTPSAQVPIKPDVSKAPGTISYSQARGRSADLAAKEHGNKAQSKAGESAEAGKEATKEAAKAVQAKAAETGEAAKQKAGEVADKAAETKEVVKEKAAETGEAAKRKAGEVADKASETKEVVKEKAAETGEAAKQKAGEVADAAKHAAADARVKAGELADATQEGAAKAGEAAREYTEVAKEKAAGVAQTVGESVSHAVEFIKERLPEVHMERTETSPADRESLALLNEATAMAGGAPVPIRTPPSETRAPAPAAKAPAPASASTATAAGDAPAVDRSIADLEPAPFRAYEPRTATTAVNRAEQKAHDVSEAAKKEASELVDATKDFAERSLDRGAAKAGAPDELVIRAEREEQSAKGPLAALADAVWGAADYVKQHVLHPPGSPRSGLSHRHPSGVGSSVEEGVVGQPEVAVVQRTGSGRVHEYSALPGDLHPAQLAKAAKGLREKVMHMPAATEETVAQARDATVGSMRSAGEEIEGTSRAAADAAGTKLEQVKGAASSVADAAAAKLDAAKDAVSDAAARTADSARDTAAEAQAKGSEIKEAAKDKAAKATTEDNAAQAKRAAEDKAAEAKRAMEEAYGSAKQSAGNAKGTVEDKAAEAKGAVAGAYDNAKASAEDAAEAVKERSAGALAAARDTVASARDSVTGAVQAAEDKAKQAFEQTKEGLKQTADNLTPGPESPEDAIRTAGIIPTDTESLLRQRGQGLESRQDEKLMDDAAKAYGEENLASGSLAETRAAATGSAGTSAVEGVKSAMHRVSEGARDARDELKSELKASRS